MKPLLDRGFVVLVVWLSGYFRVSGIAALRSSNARRGVGGEQVEAGLVVAGDS